MILRSDAYRFVRTYGNGFIRTSQLHYVMHSAANFYSHYASHKQLLSSCIHVKIGKQDTRDETIASTIAFLQFVKNSIPHFAVRHWKLSVSPWYQFIEHWDWSQCYGVILSRKIPSRRCHPHFQSCVIDLPSHAHWFSVNLLLESSAHIDEGS